MRKHNVRRGLVVRRALQRLPNVAMRERIEKDGAVRASQRNNLERLCGRLAALFLLGLE